ncbi:MAG: hypothetical protein LUG16_00865 [Candidatus Gastranaerophilales bacterium]|nr:hypothetical protein [Candidatus Gastranaerophilales bacterium]
MVNYQKSKVPIKLEKFYSMMNQAFLRYRAESSTAAFNSLEPSDGEALEAFFDKYLNKYFIYSDKGVLNSKYYYMTFNDGSGFISYVNSSGNIHFFFCTEYKYCAVENYDGKRTFLFTMYNKEFVTSSSDYDNKTREEILDSCKYGNYDNSSVSTKDKRHACARLIQIDGWQIKDDYPWNQTMLEN